MYREDLPKVVTVHENRFVAPGLQEVLTGRADVVGDTAYGAAALQLTDMLTPSVVVTGDLLGDGVIDHFLADLVRAGTRVLLLADNLPAERMMSLVGRGLSGACGTDKALVEVADAVLAVAGGGAVLPSALVASIVTQWRSAWRRGPRRRAKADTAGDGSAQRYGRRSVHQGRRPFAWNYRKDVREP